MDKTKARFRGGRVAILVLAVVAVIVAAAIWLIYDNNTADHTQTPGIPNNQASGGGGTTAPDPVKEKTGPTGEISPSPTGTGPGSDNSLLGPQQ